MVALLHGNKVRGTNEMLRNQRIVGAIVLTLLDILSNSCLNGNFCTITTKKSKNENYSDLYFRARGNRIFQELQNIKTALQQHKERPDIFVPDGYDTVDVPKEVAESMESASYADPGLVVYIPAPPNWSFASPSKR